MRREQLAAGLQAVRSLLLDRGFGQPGREDERLIVNPERPEGPLMDGLLMLAMAAAYLDGDSAHRATMRPAELADVLRGHLRFLRDQAEEINYGQGFDGSALHQVVIPSQILRDLFAHLESAAAMLEGTDVAHKGGKPDDNQQA